MLASHPHQWQSETTRVQAYGWHTIDHARRVISLKDTRKGKYKNDLIDSVTFKYELPGNSQVDALMRDTANRGLYTVHLFAVQNARDHYLGEWLTTEYVHTQEYGRNIPYILLRRLANQSASVTQMYAHSGASARKRSLNEGLHEAILAREFPDFHVLYEPECQTNIGGAMVKAGVLCKWAGDTYTVDFILASRSGCNRIAVESKYDRDAVDETALQKCRTLRDRSGQRVVIMAGRDDCVYLDMGAPGCQNETWHDNVSALKDALHICEMAENDVRN